MAAKTSNHKVDLFDFYDDGTDNDIDIPVTVNESDRIQINTNKQDRDRLEKTFSCDVTRLIIATLHGVYHKTSGGDFLELNPPRELLGIHGRYPSRIKIEVFNKQNVSSISDSIKLDMLSLCIDESNKFHSDSETNIGNIYLFSGYKFEPIICNDKSDFFSYLNNIVFKIATGIGDICIIYYKELNTYFKFTVE